MGTRLRLLSESYPMNTNVTGFKWFSKIFAFLCFGMKVASALEGSHIIQIGFSQIIYLHTEQRKKAM